MDSKNTPSACYWIEISGWDEDENFFVEQAELDWNEPDGKRVLLEHCPREGAILFVRLSQACELPPSLPVPYNVEHVRRAPGQDLWDVQLAQKRPHLTPRMAETVHS